MDILKQHMGHYIDAEKIRAEIERRKKENMYDEMPITIGRYYEDRDLLAFIDSLQQEQLDKESLNESQQEFVDIVTERMLKEGPIPTLKGKQKAEFEKEFNRFKQITGMINFPAHMEVYKRVILWFMAWGADNLPNLNKVTDPDGLDFQQEQSETDLDTDIETKKESESDENERIRQALDKIFKRYLNSVVSLEEERRHSWRELVDAMQLGINAMKEGQKSAESNYSNVNFEYDKGYKEDEKIIESICRSINEESIAEGLKCHGKSYSINELSELRIKMINFLKSINQKLKQEWSEDDKKTLDNACCWIAEYAGYLMDKNYDKASMLMGLTDKLKSLHPQSHCKISEELDTDTLRDWSMRFTPDIREAIESTAYHFYNLGSQPKQEWSDKDKAILEWCIADIERAKSHPSQTKPELCDIEINWLKALNLKKRNEDVAKLCSNEWSEEDKAFLKVAIATCNRYSHKDIADWLKSLPERLNLQPKEEWSEEDEEMMTDIIESLEYAYPNDNEFRIAWLKSLRPSWKPSEEQMKALNAVNCLGDLSYVGQQNQLISLYNDLKKLI